MRKLIESSLEKLQDRDQVTKKEAEKGLFLAGSNNGAHLGFGIAYDFAQNNSHYNNKKPTD